MTDRPNRADWLVEVTSELASGADPQRLGLLVDSARQWQGYEEGLARIQTETDGALSWMGDAVRSGRTFVVSAGGSLYKEALVHHHTCPTMRWSLDIRSRANDVIEQYESHRFALPADRSVLPQLPVFLSRAEVESRLDRYRRCRVCAPDTDHVAKNEYISRRREGWWLRRADTLKSTVLGHALETTGYDSIGILDRVAVHYGSHDAYVELVATDGSIYRAAWDEKIFINKMKASEQA